MRVRAALLAAALFSAVSCGRPFYSLRQAADGRTWLLPPRMKSIPDKPAAPPRCNDPLNPRGAHFAALGCYTETGYVDLQPGMRRKLVKPVTANGEPLKTEVVGQEGLTLAIKTNAKGVDTTYDEYVADQAFLGFPAHLIHARLFLRARLSAQDRQITVAAYPSLEARQRSTDEYCRAQPDACLVVPYGSVIAAEQRVYANTKAIYVPMGASAGEVYRGPGLRLFRSWKGKLVEIRPTPATANLAGVPLNPGDRLEWPSQP